MSAFPSSLQCNRHSKSVFTGISFRIFVPCE
uniref:Uncharacterized protein n=1 Tax=Anguilla anguilla TaxID=7936 RepID=A0A0E9QH66_ANGAN